MKTIVITLIFLPVTVLLKVFKVGGAAGGNINKLAATAKNTAKKTKVATKDVASSQGETTTKDVKEVKPQALPAAEVNVMLVTEKDISA